MTRAEAIARARADIADDVVVGENHQKDPRFYVGRRVQNEWVSYGSGSSWEEALLNHAAKKA